MYLYFFAKFILSILYKIIFRVEFKGKEKIPKNENFIICSNHKSMRDPITLAILFPKQIRFMAKEELFKIKPLAILFKIAGVFPVDRDGNDLLSLKKALSILKNNEILGIFPEGTRVKEIKKENFKEGVSFLAIKAKSNIITVNIKGDYKFLSKINVEIKDNIEINKYLQTKNKKQAREELTNDIFSSIYKGEVKELK
ncbi:MAG: lysophospholipid acyltransferase family protein [Peptoniphilaceae bacterium]|nr:1-acyl-sn-glycerol-3-phosphate acyltransferase [Peptoniphilaceae bacterium]MDD7383032.1 lysophospholipid acyltransferase family protein [Peptoniphilaceae bacterium]MDY3737783.1 lysophospholipid acyltransferase family protein [Peptoniphilaceae bacterium]